MAKFIDLNVNDQNLGKIKILDNKQVSLVFTAPVIDRPLVDRISNNLESNLGTLHYKGVSFAEGVKRIEADAFRGRSIKTVKVRSSVLESIGDRAFENCRVSKIDLDWKNYYKEDRKHLLDENFGIRKIGHNAFASNDIETLSVPPTVEHIGQYAFSYNDRLKETIMCEELIVPSSTFYDSKSNSIVYMPPVFIRSEKPAQKKQIQKPKFI